MNPHRIATASAHPSLSKKDAAYVAANYVSVEELCLSRTISPETVFGAMLNKQLPLPSYLLDDNLMVPADYLALYDEAGSLELVRTVFARRLNNARRRAKFVDERAIEEVWNDYLSGEFGICLWDVTPESIVAKAVAMENITRLTADPLLNDPMWAEELRVWVARLDLIERPFADVDEIRFKARTSRARYIIDTKQKYPDLFVLTEARLCNLD